MQPKYVAEEAREEGVGTALLGELVAQADDAGVWTIQTSIFPENAASVALHSFADAEGRTE